MSLYLDYNASAPIDPRVLNVMVDVYTNTFGNADSRTHDYGENARLIVEKARKQVAALLGVLPEEVFFTSGATESNNIAIQGLDEYAKESGKRHIITTAIEHKAVLETVKVMEKRGYKVDVISPDLSGRINASEILDKVNADTLLVSVMHVNNETGIIQPVKEIGEELTKRNILFHVDATQSCGKLVEELRALKYNMLSFSAHKLRGPQGIGALVLRRKKYKLPPVKNIMYGGQQEHGLRPGTIPVALVAGCGAACEIAEKEYAENNTKNKRLKNILLELLDKADIKYHFNGDPNWCITSTANICFPGIMSEALMLSTKKFCGISNGSACTSKSYAPSYVLNAMGVPEADILNSVRISWGADITEEEMRSNISGLLEIAKQIRN